MSSPGLKHGVDGSKQLCTLWGVHQMSGVDLQGAPKPLGVRLVHHPTALIETNDCVLSNTVALGISGKIHSGAIF